MGHVLCGQHLSKTTGKGILGELRRQRYLTHTVPYFLILFMA